MPIKTASVLVIGGAGYIGSHMVLALEAAGYEVIVLDNLCTGHRDAVSRSAKLIVGEMADKILLRQLFDTYAISAVMHFAAFIEVAESVKCPAKYYQNNVAATLNLLDVMLEYEVAHIVFSSSASVYGEPQRVPIHETHACQPIHPYGRSKRMIEEIMIDYGYGANLRYAILRYFNAAGADPLGRLYERHQPETHLIPLALQVALGQRDLIHIYGSDYATSDGTCVRDYVHVTDLCMAHLLALKRLEAGASELLYNLGAGIGYSVKQILDAVRKVTRHPIPSQNHPRRSGDPAILVADISRAQIDLGWEPQFSAITTIVQHVWNCLRRRQTEKM